MRKFFVFCLLLTSLHITAQRNEIHNDNIASLQVVADDNWLSPPVIMLNRGQHINISFDDLTHEYHRYVYRIEHCEADWSPSENLFAADFCDGFVDGNVIEDMMESVNTNVLYTHYTLQIPNKLCVPKISGNYKVHVYDGNTDEPAFTACFMMVEPLFGVRLDVTTNTDVDINGGHQQISMSINYGSQRVTSPKTEIKTVVMQNGRWTNAVRNAEPQYIMSDGLQWEHNKSLIFDAGNEFHKFETLDVTHTTLGLQSVAWDGNDYHAYVWPDDPRPNYVYDEDANGAFYIRNSDNVENDRVSEYLFVHFQLNTMPLEGRVFINGVWTHDQFLPQYEMVYDQELKAYTLTVPLKQGYYSYQYVLQLPDGTCRYVPSEGSFFQTENQYQALVYFRGTGQRTDRLVGYQQITFR